MTKRSRTRTGSALPSGALRPDKVRRVEEIYPGFTVDNPIILDDEPDNDPIGRTPDRGQSESSDLVEVDMHGLPLFGRRKTKTPESSHEDLEQLDTSPTRLFYHDTGRPGPNTPAARVLPIQTKQDRSGKAKQNTVLQLSPKWPSYKSNRVVNVYLEGRPFIDSHLDQYSHLHLPNLQKANLDTITFRDVRAELARFLEIKNPFDLQLEVQHARALTKQKIFKDGLCKRENAAWDDVAVNDTQPLSKALTSPDAWLRVRVTEHVGIDITNKNITIAITPSAASTIGSLRQLIATVSETSPGAVSMYGDYSELDEDVAPLQYMGLNSGATILATVETRECVNCLDDVGARDFPFEPTTDECAHDLDICKSCIHTWITTSLDQGNWKNIACLSADCGAIMQYADLRRNSADEDMIRYERFATRDALAEMPDFKWCINPQCDAGQIHDDGGGTEQILTCQVCQFKRCIACDRPWHQDETCEQYTQRLAAQPGEVDASEAWVANNSRKCPGCQSPIQKNDGCDHMTCTRCRRQFCWLCMADYRDIHREGNTAHAPHCQYNSGRIPDPHAPGVRRPAPLPAPRRGRVVANVGPANAPANNVAGVQAAAAQDPGFPFNIPGFGLLRGLAAPAVPPQAPAAPAQGVQNIVQAIAQAGPNPPDFDHIRRNLQGLRNGLRQREAEMMAAQQQAAMVRQAAAIQHLQNAVHRPQAPPAPIPAAAGPGQAIQINLNGAQHVVPLPLGYGPVHIPQHPYDNNNAPFAGFHPNYWNPHNR